MANKSWVIVKFNNHIDNIESNCVNTIKIWPDYDYAWGSSIYKVLGYYDGSYNNARKYAKLLNMENK